MLGALLSLVLVDHAVTVEVALGRRRHMLGALLSLVLVDHAVAVEVTFRRRWGHMEFSDPGLEFAPVNDAVRPGYESEEHVQHHLLARLGIRRHGRRRRGRLEALRRPKDDYGMVRRHFARHLGHDRSQGQKQGAGQQQRSSSHGWYPPYEVFPTSGGCAAIALDQTPVQMKLHHRARRRGEESHKGTPVREAAYIYAISRRVPSKKATRGPG